MTLTYKNTLIENAKNLRKNMTSQEKKLWYEYLRTYPIRFQRQKPIENYIADFYCFKVKLVIEIDGWQHFTEAMLEYDKRRTESFEKYGITVIRFDNADVDERFDEVCMTIDMTVGRLMDDEAE